MNPKFILNCIQLVPKRRTAYVTAGTGMSDNRKRAPCRALAGHQIDRLFSFFVSLPIFRSQIDDFV